MRHWWALLTAILVVAFLGAACSNDEGGDGIVDNGDAATSDDLDDGADADAAASGDAGSDSSGDFGSIVFGDETIALTAARCFLEVQDAAGGGGKILFTAQGFGDDSAGEPVVLDVSRYDEDSQFTGDKTNVVIGDPFSDTAASWDANGEIGTVGIDGSTVSADGLTWVNSDDLSEKPGSFSLNC